MSANYAVRLAAYNTVSQHNDYIKNGCTDEFGGVELGQVHWKSAHGNDALVQIAATL